MIAILCVVNLGCAAILLSIVWWWATDAPLLEVLTKAEKQKERRVRRAEAARCTLLFPLWGLLLGAVAALLVLGIYVAGLLFHGVANLWDDAHLPADPLPQPPPRDEGPYRTAK